MQPDQRSEIGAAKALGWAGAAVALAVLLAYANSFRGVLLMDDEVSIERNPAIRALWPPGAAFSPPANSTLGGRPLANFTFALNYAFGGATPAGYHAVNLVIHLLAGGVLFAFVRRTRRRVGNGGEAEAAWLALGVAGLWLAHPLLTGTVTYLSQRTEALAGLFYLATLYAFARGAETGARGWMFAAVACCALGMACKEIVVTAPVMALLYDRTFVAGTVREAWRRRWRWYLALAATWLWLAWLMRGLGQRGVSYGQGVAWWRYALAECEAVLRYLGLGLWPQPLVFDYGPVYPTPGEALPWVLALATLGAGVLWALVRRPRMGFFGAAFFLLLAPTSSVVPVAAQPIAENRAYLPCALVVAAGVMAAHAALGRHARWLLAIAGLGLAVLTAARNDCYRSARDLWADAVAKRPQNPRAHNNRGKEFLLAGELAAAIACFKEAMRRDPNYPEASANHATALAMMGRVDEAIGELGQLLRAHPEFFPARLSLGNVLHRAGRRAEAAAQFEAALRTRPDYAEARANLIGVLLQLGRPGDAMQEAGRALAAQPRDPRVRNQLAQALLAQGRAGEALAEFTRVLRDEPRNADAHHGLGMVFAAQGRPDEARRSYEEALRLNPLHAEAHANLGAEWFRAGRMEDAVREAEAALQIDPSSATARSNLSAALRSLGRHAEALAQAEAALRLDPHRADAHFNAGTALLSLGRAAAAVPHLEAELAARPGHDDARFNLGGALFQQGDFAAALAHYRAVAERQPQNLALRRNLGAVLLRLGRADEAVIEYRAAVQLAPDRPEARRDLSLVLATLGRRSEAIAELEGVLRLAPGDSMATEHLARLRADSTRP